MEKQNLKKLVTELLTKYEKLRDCDNKLTANVWNILTIEGTLTGQKLLQFKIVNNSGGESDIETAFMRLV